MRGEGIERTKEGIVAFFSDPVTNCLRGLSWKLAVCCEIRPI
jgi:hypothetical protein